MLKSLSEETVVNKLRIYFASDLLKYSGLVIWLTSVLGLLLVPFLIDEPMARFSYLGWWAAELLFGALYLQMTWHWPSAPQARWWVYLGCMTLAALACSWFTMGGVGGILLMVVASLLPWFTQPRLGISWMAIQSAAVTLLVLRNPEVKPLAAIVLGATFMGLGFFAYIASMATQQLSAARDELRRVNSELRATQSLLTENTRIAERVRIARELHDLVGHHLTALTLNLEVATHLIEGKALEHVHQARSVARLLLSDVREVVSEMRSNDAVNLAEALQKLVEGVPQPKIHLAIPDGFSVTDPQRAQVLLRCAQEVITNTVRHASARNLWLTLEVRDNELHLTAKDDGQGMVKARIGNGLSGMRERLRQLGGGLDLDTATGRGFMLHAHLPTE